MYLFRKHVSRIILYCVYMNTCSLLESSCGLSYPYIRISFSLVLVYLFLFLRPSLVLFDDNLIREPKYPQYKQRFKVPNIEYRYWGASKS